PLRLPSRCRFIVNDTATTEIYTLSLHDALPISAVAVAGRGPPRPRRVPDRARVGGAGGQPAVRRGRRDRQHRQAGRGPARRGGGDRKSTRLNSSHVKISYAVFCLKKKKKKK